MVTATVERTSDGLRVSRRGDDVDIESDMPAVTQKLRIRLAQAKGGPTIVQQASGVRLSKPLGNERVRAIELVGLVQNTKGLEGSREFLDIDMMCSKVNFVATKQAGK
jgi:hypothetical protein